MNSDAKKRKNRFISFICIGVFVLGVAAVGVVTGVLIKNVVYNNQLNAIKEELIIEKNNYTQGKEDEDCYTVYVKDDYTLSDGEIYVFQK